MPSSSVPSGSRQVIGVSRRHAPRASAARARSDARRARSTRSTTAAPPPRPRRRGRASALRRSTRSAIVRRSASNGTRASTACTSDPNPAPRGRSSPIGRATCATTIAAASIVSGDPAATAALRCAARGSTRRTRRPLAHRLDHDRRHAAGGARVGARQPPAIVATAPVRDDVLRHVLDDQLLAADAERRLRAERQRARIPPHDASSRRPRTHAVRGRRSTAPAGLVVRPLQHRVLRLERRTLRTARRHRAATPSADTARG